MRLFCFTLCHLFVLLCLWAQAEPSLDFVQLSDPHAGHPAFSEEIWEDVWRDVLARPGDVILLSGDQVDNRGSKSEFLARTDRFLEDLSGKLRSRPEALAITLGNNDLWPNHSTDPEILESVIALYRKNLGSRSYLNDLGNGVMKERPRKTVWISLNAQIFSRSNPYQGADEQARRSLTWLSEELGQLEPDQTVVLLPHIAPVLDIWSEQPSWREPWPEELSQVLRRHPLRYLLLSGHFHRNEIHSLDLGEGRVAPMLVAGALSRKYDYHSNWRRYQLDGDRLDYRLFYPEHPDWEREYSLKNIYSPDTFLDFKERLSQNSKAYQQYVQDLYARHAQWKERGAKANTRHWILKFFLIPAREEKSEP